MPSPFGYSNPPHDVTQRGVGSPGIAVSRAFTPEPLGSAGSSPAPRGRGARRGAPAGEAEEDSAQGRPEAAIRPERFARLVTLASILIEAGRDGQSVPIVESAG